jgi:hypothetical protein
MYVIRPEPTVTLTHPIVNGTRGLDLWIHGSGINVHEVGNRGVTRLPRIPTVTPIPNPSNCFATMGYRILATECCDVPNTNRRKASRAFRWIVQGPGGDRTKFDVVCWQHAPGVPTGQSAEIVCEHMFRMFAPFGLVSYANVGAVDLLVRSPQRSRRAFDLFEHVRKHVSPCGRGLAIGG